MFPKTFKLIIRKSLDYTGIYMIFQLIMIVLILMILRIFINILYSIAIDGIEHIHKYLMKKYNIK